MHDCASGFCWYVDSQGQVISL